MCETPLRATKSHSLSLVVKMLWLIDDDCCEVFNGYGAGWRTIEVVLEAEEMFCDVDVPNTGAEVMCDQYQSV